MKGDSVERSNIGLSVCREDLPPPMAVDTRARASNRSRAEVAASAMRRFRCAVAWERHGTLQMQR
jgi:hypothetical protein